jgi:hypothetical protein
MSSTHPAVGTDLDRSVGRGPSLPTITPGCASTGRSALILRKNILCMRTKENEGIGWEEKSSQFSLEL